MSEENSPYQAPESDLVVSADSQGGSLAGGKAGDYELSIRGVFSDAWGLLSGVKLTFWLAFIAYLAVIMGISFVVGLLSGLLGSAGTSQLILGIATQVIITIIGFPLMAGIILMGINRSVGKEISVGMIFNNWGHTLTLVLSYIIMMIMIGIGFVLLVIPGIYLLVAYTMAVPLIVEKGLGPWEALEASRQAISKRWFSVFGIFFCIMVVMIISAIPLGIGMIWTLPLSTLVLAVMYRDIFGVDEKL